MKIKASLIAVAASALLAACGQPNAANENTVAPAAAAGPVELKAPAGVYALDPTHATLQASVLHNTISHYTVRFNKVEGKVALDTANLENSSVEFTVDPTSVDANFPGDYVGTHANSGFKSWNEDIANNTSNLNAGQFKTMTFKSTKVTKTGERTADVTGDLTFLGVTKPVTFKATFNGEIESHPFLQVPAIGFAAEGTFKRTDFGMALGYVGDEVTVRFDGEFIKQADAAAPAAQ